VLPLFQLRLAAVQGMGALAQGVLDLVELVLALLDLGFLRLDLVLELLDDLPNRNAVARQIYSSILLDRGL
jgi:hypothetical protein